MRIPPSSTDGNFISELESLRGVAITCVLLYHIHCYFLKHHMAKAPDLVSKACLLFIEGHTGVTLFFILSAFLLSRPFLKALNGEATLDKKSYFKRRFLRIMPLYALSVTMAVVVNFNQPDVWVKGIKALFFVPGSGGLDLQPFSGPWWSLATEVQFYLLLPLLFMGLSNDRYRKVTYLLFAAYIAIYTSFIFRFFTIPSTYYLAVLVHTLFGRLPVFLTGILAAGIYLKYGHKIKARFEASKGYLSYSAGDAAVLTCFLMLSLLLIPIHGIGGFKADILYVFWHIGEGVIWAMILLLFLLVPFHAKPIFCNRYMCHLGTTSYSIYLWHLPIIVWGAKLNQRWGLDLIDHPTYFFFVFLPLLIAMILWVSSLSYRYIELPFLLRKANV